MPAAVAERAPAAAVLAMGARMVEAMAVGWAWVTAAMAVGTLVVEWRATAASAVKAATAAAGACTERPTPRDVVASSAAWVIYS